MKKFALAFSAIPLTLFTLISHANTYSVNFFNPTSATMTEKVTPNESTTHIECSGSCTSLPPGSNVTYTISSNELHIPWGAFTAVLTYAQNSNYCDSAEEGMTFTYNVTNYTLATPPFSINVGETLPNGLYGMMNTTKKCAG